MAEPVRKSVYDILENTLKLANRKTFIHRYVYMGEHKNDSDELELEGLMEKIVKTINEGYCEEPLTGLLLIYANYFVHIIDGSEDSIIKHFTILYEQGASILGRTKLLITYHHINQRLFDVWDYKCTRPPILLEKIDPACGFEETKRYLEICIKKVYNLAIELRQVDPEKVEPTTVGKIMNYMHQYLPEYKLLDFLLNSVYIRDVKELMASFHTIPNIKFYSENIWPVRSDFVPYDVFDKEKNPIQSLKHSNN